MRTEQHRTAALLIGLRAFARSRRLIMTLRRIYSASALSANSRSILRGSAANHALRVLRLRRGDRLVIFDGSGHDFDAEIIRTGRAELELAIGDARPIDNESPLTISLFQGVARGQRMDTLIQKATELGVTRIQPLLTERSVVRLDAQSAERKREHWQRVVMAACEQCGRSHLPEVSAAGPFAELITGMIGHPTRLLLDPRGESLATLAVPIGAVALLIGPEGGLSKTEVELAEQHGFRRLRLGPRIMRTETAPLAALALLQFLAGDFR